MRYFSLGVAILFLAGCGAPPQNAENSAEDVAISEDKSPETVPGTVDAADAAAEGVEAGDAADAAASGSDAAASAGDEDPGSGEAVALPRPPGDTNKVETDVAFCAPARQPLSAAACQAVKDQQASLENGVAAFAPPATMTRGRTERVRLAIGSESDRPATVAAAGGDDAAGAVPVKIGRFMKATLSGANFAITPVGDPNRDLGATSSELWEWDVVPQSKGVHRLQVRIETFAEGPASQPTRLSLYRSPPISVEVVVTPEEAIIDKTTIWQRVVEALTGWLGAAAAFVVALSLLVWRLRNFGRAPADDEEGGDKAEGGSAGDSGDAG